MATLIFTNGEKKRVVPENGKTFQLQELRRLVECDWIEVVNMKDGRLLVVDEEGKLRKKRCNTAASIIYNHPYDVIVGNALLCDAEEIE